jgi:hypothetical protein
VHNKTLNPCLVVRPFMGVARGADSPANKTGRASLVLASKSTAFELPRSQFELLATVESTTHEVPYRDRHSPATRAACLHRMRLQQSHGWVLP